MPSKYGHTPEDILHRLQRQVDSLEKQVDQLKNKKTISAPIRTLADIVKSTPGQFIIDEVDIAGFFGSDNSLHQLLGTDDGDLERFRIETFKTITVPENSITDLVTLNFGYVGGIMLAQGWRTSSAANTYYATVGFRGDNNVAGTSKIQEFNWSAGGFAAPAFAMSAAGTGVKTLRVTTPAGIGNTNWQGLVFYLRGAL